MMRGWLRRVLPWVVGLAFLVYLFQRIPWVEFRHALAEGPYLEMTVFISLQISLTLIVDGWATAVSLSAVGIERPMREVMLARGATYLLGLINYAVGQGGLGLYLHRTGVPGQKASGSVLFLIAINGFVLVLAAALVWPFARGPYASWVLLGAGAGVVVAAGAIAYITRRPGRFEKNPLVDPWLVAGPGGILRSAAARLVHVAVLVVGLWAGLRVWGIPVPFLEGLVRMPVVLLVSALPISPSGLGTTQAAQVLLFSEFATESTVAARESAALAQGLVNQVVGVVVQVIVALFCLARLRARRIILSARES